MTRTIRPQDLIDSTVMDRDGNKLGKVGSVYLSDGTQQPEWVTVKTGLFGHKESFVPLSGADMDNDGLHVKVEKQQVSDAPRIDAEGHLSQQESVELYRHYQLPSQRTGERPDPGMGTQAGVLPGKHGESRDLPQPSKNARTAGAGENRQSAAQGQARQGESITRSEERLKVGTEQVETGHVRLHKYVVTEEQQVTVPVSHEEVRVEREPITDARGIKAEIGEAEQDIVLHAEKPVISTETVPVEKVRLGTEKVMEEQNISQNVRKERIEIEDDSGNKRK